ncbi:hypothetical protein MG293_010984 [Ovis ammon polii]|uniref:Uncharacterized protein n=1 Tax=Ovis ammon polii TaxID=230172 RepID=A0AAD4U5K7_OVIAM|nr:hypothetical protein MG293_010984 [Ovis ammon polii]
MKRCQNRSQDPGLVAVPGSCFLPHSIASAVEHFTAVRRARSHSCGAHSFLTGKLMFPVNRIETEVKNIFHGNILLSSRLELRSSAFLRTVHEPASHTIRECCKSLLPGSRFGSVKTAQTLLKF